MLLCIHDRGPVTGSSCHCAVVHAMQAARRAAPGSRADLCCAHTGQVWSCITQYCNA
jgi:hypothetical protein